MLKVAIQKDLKKNQEIKNNSKLLIQIKRRFLLIQRDYISQQFINNSSLNNKKHKRMNLLGVLQALLN